MNPNMNPILNGLPGLNNYSGEFSIPSVTDSRSDEELNLEAPRPPVKTKLITAMSAFLNGARRNIGIQKRIVTYVFNLDQ